MKLERVGPVRQAESNEDPTLIPVEWTLSEVGENLAALPDRLCDGIPDKVVHLKWPNGDLFKFETVRERWTFATGIVMAVEMLKQGDVLDYVCKWLQSQNVDPRDEFNAPILDEKKAAWAGLGKTDKKRALEVCELISGFVKG